MLHATLVALFLAVVAAPAIDDPPATPPPPPTADAPLPTTAPDTAPEPPPPPTPPPPTAPLVTTPAATTPTTPVVSAKDAHAKKEEESEEDQVNHDQSVDAYSDLEDAEAGKPGSFEERLWLTWGFVPAEGNTPSDTLELSYTGTGFLKNSEFDLGQYFEHDDVDNTTAFIFGWMQRWVADGGRDSLVPSVGTLTEYYLRTPFLEDLPEFAPGATVGDHIAEIVTVAKYVGDGTAYVNLEGQMQLFNTQICVNEDDVAIQPKDAIDQNGPAAPNFDGCDYWAPYTVAVRAGYKYPVVKDKLDLLVDYTLETNEFSTQTKSKTLQEPEPHSPYSMGNVSLIWHVDEDWTISPGVLFGLDGRDETPQYEAGIFILHE